MQTITITITSANLTNIVVKERKPQRQNIVDKLGQLLTGLDPNQKVLTALVNKG